MKVLLDECVDWRLLRDLSEHEVKTLKQVGWEKFKDGALLRLAASEFDVFITVDTKLPYQQNLSGLELAVIVVRARTTRLADVRELLEMIHRSLQHPRFGEFEILSWHDHV